MSSSSTTTATIDIVGVANQLQSAVTPTEIEPLLHSLSTVDVPLQTLIDTKLGRTVKKLAKHDDSRVSSYAGSLLKKWASQIDPNEVESNKRKLSVSASSVASSDASATAVGTTATTTTTTPVTTVTTVNNNGNNNGTVENVAKRAKLTKSASDSKSATTATAGAATDSRSVSSTTAASNSTKSSSQESDSGAGGGGSVRDRAVTMLTDALTRQTDSSSSSAASTTTAAAGASSSLSASNDQIALNDFESEPLSIATQIEEALFEKHKDCGKDYKAQLRSLVFNLKNKKNPALRQSLMLQTLSPTDFVAMKVHDMADPELAQARIDAAEWAKKVAMARSLNLAAPTNAFTCRKCNKSECRYIQLQTRSADEPMTTFISCVNCGNRWKN